jgi:oligosaccharide amylase
MTKTYINNAIIGNSNILGCINDRGEIVRLFWPNIDYPQHIEQINTGVFFCGHKNSTMWLNEDCFNHSQRYIENTNILETVFENTDKGIQIRQIDYVLTDKDILLRQYEIKNTGASEIDLGVVTYSSGVSTTPDLSSTLFDFKNDALIHYKHNYYLSVSYDVEVFQFQLGNNAFDSAKYTELKGYDSIGMMNDGAISIKLGLLKTDETKAFTAHICVSNSLKGVKELLRTIKKSDLSIEFFKTKEYWIDYINMATRIRTGNKSVDDLYKRSLLVFKLMADEKSGGLLASPEIDEGFTKCGRYAYCWGRDAAFITAALDKCGLSGTVDKFYSWASEVQDEDGSWQQRYHMDGNLAPSWGLQIDETGTIIWGILQHYKVTEDKSFLRGMWPSVKKGVEFLISFIDEDTGLPSPSYDLWEERVGEHAYSSAAVCAGIRASVLIADLLDEPVEIIKHWDSTWKSIMDSMIKNLWKDEKGCFLRSIRTKMNPWGGEYSDKTTIIKVNSKNYYRDVTLEDGMVDVSLLGICIPFEVLKTEDFRIVKTAEKIEQVLTVAGVGGIKRYENDNYIGGNPWVLTTLWVSLYHIKRKNFAKAKEYFEWAVKARTHLDLLPEQVNKYSGAPEWVIPLTWSHAMFVLVLFELLENEAL